MALLPHIIRKIGLHYLNIRISAALLTHCSRFSCILGGNNAAKDSEMSYFFSKVCVRVCIATTSDMEGLGLRPKKTCCYSCH